MINNEKLTKTIELQSEMFDRLSDFIEALHRNGEIDKVEYVIARDVLFDSTENHQDICENNVAESFIENKTTFIRGLKAGHEEMKKDHPSIDDWDKDSINDYSHLYIDCVH